MSEPMRPSGAHALPDPIACGDCGAPMRLKRGLYGQFFGCTRWPECDGVHGADDQGRPLGVPANRETRRARAEAHAAFDALWQGGSMTRQQAYRWLRSTLGLTAEECHIGRFDVVICARVKHAVAQLKADAERRVRHVRPAPRRRRTDEP